MENAAKPASPRELPLPAGGGDRNAVPGYDFARVKIVDHLIPDMPLRVSALRTLGGFGNVFAVESFMDEVASATNTDPIDFRLKYVKDPRDQALIKGAAEKFGWDKRPSPKKGQTGSKVTGRGIAYSQRNGTRVAVIAEVEVDRESGKIFAKRFTVAHDCGSTSIGFGARVVAPEDRRTGEIFREVEPEDLLKYGLIPEFVGRLPVVATLEDLDEASLKKILTEPKNALVKQYQRLFEMESIDLTLAEEALGAISRKAIERKTGARGLRSIMEGILLDTMFDLPSLEGVEEVVISKEVVEGTARPLYIYADRAGDAGASAS